MSSLNKFFGGLKQAGVSGRGNYFPYANAKYRCTINRFFYKSDRKDVFVAELDVVETVAFSASNPNFTAPVPGEKRSWVIDMTKELNMVQRDANGFILAAIGVNANNKADTERALEEIEALMQFAISESNPLGGAPIDLETYEHKTKAKGTDFTIHNWQPSPSGQGMGAWLAKLPGRSQARAPAIAPAAPTAAAQSAGFATGAPVQIGNKWFIPQADGSLRPIG